MPTILALRRLRQEHYHKCETIQGYIWVLAQQALQCMAPSQSVNSQPIFRDKSNFPCSNFLSESDGQLWLSSEYSLGLWKQRWEPAARRTTWQTRGDEKTVCHSAPLQPPCSRSATASLAYLERRLRDNVSCICFYGLITTPSWFCNNNMQGSRPVSLSNRLPQWELCLSELAFSYV